MADRVSVSARYWKHTIYNGKKLYDFEVSPKPFNAKAYFERNPEIKTKKLRVVSEFISASMPIDIFNRHAVSFRPIKEEENTYEYGNL